MTYRRTFTIPPLATVEGELLPAQEGWLQLLEPHEVTNRSRRKVRTFMSGLAPTMQRIEDCQKVRRDALKLPELAIGEEPSQERIEALSEADSRAMFDANLSDEEMDRMQVLNDAALAETIIGWSLPGDPSRSTIDELQTRIYDAVISAGLTAATALVKDMNVDFSIKNPDPVSGAADPTGA